MPEKSFIDVRDASAGYSVFTGHWPLQQKQWLTILKDINFVCNQGNHLTLFGAAKSGKTTFLKLLAGAVKPLSGSVIVNGQPPADDLHVRAGYISAQPYSTIDNRTVQQLLTKAIHQSHRQALPAHLSEVSEAVSCADLWSRPCRHLSTTEVVRVRLAMGLLLDAPLLLLDDVADVLDPDEVTTWAATILRQRTLIITTRQAVTAEKLDLPLLLLRHGSLSQPTSREDLGKKMAFPQVVDVWLEGLHYDLVRQLRQEAGVINAKVLPCSVFAGQRVRLTLRSAHYLPLMYDVMSKVPLIKIEEQPISLAKLLQQW